MMRWWQCGWWRWYSWWCWWGWWCWWWYWWWGLYRWWTKAKTYSFLIPDKSSRLILKVTIMQMRIWRWNSGSPFMLAAYKEFLTTSPFSRATPKDWDPQWLRARGDCGTSPKDRGKSPRKPHKGPQSSQESLVLQGRKFKCRAMYCTTYRVFVLLTVSRLAEGRIETLVSEQRSANRSQQHRISSQGIRLNSLTNK